MFDDLEMIHILHAATAHQKLEIVQIVQCLSDYYQTYSYIRADNKKMNRQSVMKKSVRQSVKFSKDDNDNLNF